MATHESKDRVGAGESDVAADKESGTGNRSTGGLHELGEVVREMARTLTGETDKFEEELREGHEDSAPPALPFPPRKKD